MGNLLSNPFKGEFSTLEIVANLFLPMAQLYFRIFKLNGSLDKPWLLLPFFLIFPFSALPTFMMHYGYVKKGAGGPVHDNWMYLPVVFYVLYNMFLEYLESDMDILFRLGGLFVSILVPYFIREYNNCKTLGLNQYANIFSNSALVLGISYLCLPLVSILGYMPLIGILFNLLEMLREIPIVGEPLLWAIWFLPTYIVVNMFNYINGLEKYCGRNHHYILGIVGLVLSIGGYYLDDFIYFS